MTTRDDQFLTGWSAPSAPSALKARALAAARDPSKAPRPRRIEDRLWDSRSLRYGWMAAASVLLVLNVVAGTTEQPSPTPTRSVVEVESHDDFDVGTEIPVVKRPTWTLAEAQEIAEAMLTDPCLDPMAEGDCT